MQPQQTGFQPQFQQQQGQFMQPMMTGMPQQSPFADPGRSAPMPMQPQQTGYQPPFQPQPTGFGQQPPQGGINSYLPPPLQPQPTGFGQPPQQQQAPAAAPLQPQQTGPAPPVRFGTQSKLTPQQTGRKANLAQASKLITILV
jgi:hypothetical protein